MEIIKDKHKIILQCNKNGMLEEVFLDSAALLENITLPVGLHSLVSPISIKELGKFWLAIRQHSMSENSLLTLTHQNRELSFLFSGYLLNETILLCGNTELPQAEQVLDEIMLINNEQANQIRLTEKRVVNILNKDDKNELNEAFLNDFSALNNELINNKRELMSQNKKIEALNKELNDVNENMSMFTYSVSHDLKEPVRMVKSFLTLLHKKYEDNLDQKGREYINFALDGANRLSNMMADLLQYHQSSNLDSTEFVDLNEVLQEVKDILQKVIEEKNAQISSSKLPLVRGSAAGYRQVLQNLISNAIKFVPAGKAPVISIIVYENDTNYTIGIKDNGMGIAEDQKQHVFKLFKRLHTSDQYEGTGMGLAMVRKSIERMGGEIWMESVEGIGSTFFISIKKDPVPLGNPSG